MGTRVSVFVDPDPEMVEGAANADADAAVEPYVRCAHKARKLGLGINAGHDLDLNNLKFLKDHIPFLDEVSIGHALICDALYFGLENTIQLYLRQLRS